MKKGIGEKVLGWFVVPEDEDDAKASADGEASANVEPASAPVAVAPSASAPLKEARASERPLSLPAVPPGQPHDPRAFAEVYHESGIPTDERDRVTKVTELIRSLPAEAGADVQRAIVGAALQAFGVSIDRLAETAEASIGALDGYVTAGDRRTEGVLGDARARIAKLEAEIAEVHRLMDLQVVAQAELARAVAEERERMESVLAFFGRRPRPTRPKEIVLSGR